MRRNEMSYSLKQLYRCAFYIKNNCWEGRQTLINHWLAELYWEAEHFNSDI